MLEANLKILSALKDFLQIIVKTEDYLNCFRNRSTDFTRIRKLSFEKLVLLIVRLCKKSLSVELEAFFQEMNAKIVCSVSAFSQQRLKLNPSFFYAWNMALWTNYYSEYKQKVKRWKGFRITGVDGSNISLVNRPELKKYFGGQSNQTSSYVIAKVFYFYDVLNKMILYPSIAPYRYSELYMASDVIESGVIKEDMLLILDRYFGNYMMAALLNFQERTICYIMRMNESSKVVREFITSRKETAIIELIPSPSSIKTLKKYGYTVTTQTKIKVRLVRVVLCSGEIEVLMTNLWEEDGYETHEFKSLYNLRWGIETNIGFQKNILQLESMSGLTPLAVMQDFYATVFISNLHNLLIKQAQQTIEISLCERKYPMQVNNNKAFGKIKKHLIELFVSSDPRHILKTLHEYFIQTPLPIRKNRSFPRIRKNQMAKCKHRTFTNYKPTF